MKKLTRITALLCMICTLICFASCGEKMTSWQTTSMAISGEPLYIASEVSLGSSSVKIKDVWVNLGSFDKDTISFTLSFGNTSSSVNAKSITVKKEDFNKSGDGWVKVVSDFNRYYTNIKVVTSEVITFNEIIVINGDNKQAKVSFSRAGVSDSSDGNGTSSQYLSKEEIEALDKSDRLFALNNAWNIADEQESFPESMLED